MLIFLSCFRNDNNNKSKLTNINQFVNVFFYNRIIYISITTTHLLSIARRFFSRFICTFTLNLRTKLCQLCELNQREKKVAKMGLKENEMYACVLGEKAISIQRVRTQEESVGVRKNTNTHKISDRNRNDKCKQARLCTH